MRFGTRDRPGLAWLDRVILPRATAVAPSRSQQHTVQHRVSRLDHLRPHRLNWEALEHPGDATGADDEGRLVGILLYVWLSVRPILGTRDARPGASPTGAV